MATNAMLAVNEVAESIVYKKLTVSIHRRCLLSSENEKEQVAELTQCIDKSYACCLLSLKKRMINLSRTLRRTHIPSEMVYKCALVCRKEKMKLVQSEKNSSELKKVCTYVRSVFTWNKKIFYQVEKGKHPKAIGVGSRVK